MGDPVLYQPKDLEDLLADKWTFRWGLMDVLIGGKSPIDLTGLNLGDREKARKFVESYGFSLESEPDSRLIHAIIVESLSFIEKFLMPKEWSGGEQPPEEILLCDDIAQLLLWASNDADNGREKLRSLWACACLRVMHTIAHIRGVHRKVDMVEAKNQIIANFGKAMFRTADGRLLFGNAKNNVELEKIEWKASKSRSSIILKLLHKPANVAETIYDLIGVRIITKSYADVVQVVKILSDQFVVSFPNANPKRSRNSLIDLELFRAQIESLTNQFHSGKITSDEFLHGVSKIKPPNDEKNKKSNPHSGSTYRSVQMTCRQLIKFKDPALKWLDKSDSFLEVDSRGRNHEVLTETVNFVRYWMKAAGVGEDLGVHFPFEVQVFDKTTREFIEQSESNHIFYKRAQVRTARRRVLSEVLNFYKGR